MQAMLKVFCWMSDYIQFFYGTHVYPFLQKTCLAQGKRLKLGNGANLQTCELDEIIGQFISEQNLGIENVPIAKILKPMVTVSNIAVSG